MWDDLAEIRSLAVSSQYQKIGIGKNLVKQCLKEARTLGLKRVFALTYQPDFFKKLGFEDFDKAGLPQEDMGRLFAVPQIP